MRDATGLSPASLHIVMAIAIFLVALVLLRRGSRAFIAVVVAQLGNEALDMIGDVRTGGGVKLGEAVADTALTVGTAAVLWGLAVMCGRALRNAFAAGE